MNVSLTSGRIIDHSGLHGVLWFDWHDGRPANSPCRSISKTLLGNPASLQRRLEGLIALLSGLSLDCQFLLHGLQSLLHSLPVGLGPPNLLVLCQTLVRKLRLNVANRVLRFAKQPLSVLPRRAL